MYNWRLKFWVYWSGFWFCWSVLFIILGLHDGNMFRVIFHSFFAVLQLCFLYAFRHQHEMWLDREEARLEREREQNERRD